MIAWRHKGLYSSFKEDQHGRSTDISILYGLLCGFAHRGWQLQEVLYRTDASMSCLPVHGQVQLTSLWSATKASMPTESCQRAQSTMEASFTAGALPATALIHMSRLWSMKTTCTAEDGLINRHTAKQCYTLPALFGAARRQQQTVKGGWFTCCA